MDNEKISEIIPEDTMNAITDQPTESIAPHEGESKGKKKNKSTKKSAKLDTKSKLEKSRQSARECRARKKLRYQYLEDLVNSREKAVVKLRDELHMFSDLSKRADFGALKNAAKVDYSSSCGGVTSVGILDASSEPS